MKAESTFRLRIIALMLAVLVVATVTATAYGAQKGVFTACQRDVALRPEPAFEAERFGAVPENERVEVLYEYEFWTLLDYNGQRGWAPSFAICPEGGRKEDALLFMYNRVETKKGKHRYYFGMFNPGPSHFMGFVRLNVYSGDDLILQKDMDFTHSMIRADEGKAFYVDTEKEMSGYWFEQYDQMDIKEGFKSGEPLPFFE